MDNNSFFDSDQVERIEIEVAGKGWVVTHEKPHCTLGLKQKREVFLNAHDMVLWVLEQLSPYGPENQKKTTYVPGDE